jgi:hypothetical protein
MAGPSKAAPTPGEWGPCPPGAFEQLAAKLRARRRRRFFLRTAVTGAGVAAAAGVGWLAWSMNQDKPADFGGIACPEVVRLGPEYAKGDLSKELREKIRIHISLCPNCGPYYRSKGWTT